MTLQDIIEIITNNGLSVLCVVYLIYFQSTTMKDMTNALNLISERLAKIETKIDKDERRGD